MMAVSCMRNEKPCNMAELPKLLHLTVNGVEEHDGAINF